MGEDTGMPNHIVPPEIADRYEVHEWRNGLAILSAARPGEWKNIIESCAASRC
jgi:hypothetical protein